MCAADDQTGKLHGPLHGNDLEKMGKVDVGMVMIPSEWEFIELTQLATT